MEHLGIIAGSGQFPALVAKGARDKGRQVFICGIAGNANPDLAQFSDAFVMLNIGQFGGLIDFFKKHQVRELCMAGAINKPRTLDIRPDLRAAKLLFALASHRGDDAILRAVASELHKEGFTVVRPESLVPRIESPSGLLTELEPDSEIWRDIRFGWNMAREMGRLDIGQCVVVKNGVVVAVEAIEGTNATIERAASLAGSGCTLVKVCKPGQDERLDLPSIGLTTLERLEKYGFAALAYEAGKTLFFDQEASIAKAREAGICLLGIPENAEEFFQKQKLE